MTRSRSGLPQRHASATVAAESPEVIANYRSHHLPAIGRPKQLITGRTHERSRTPLETEEASGDSAPDIPSRRRADIVRGGGGRDRRRRSASRIGSNRVERMPNAERTLSCADAAVIRHALLGHAPAVNPLSSLAAPSFPPPITQGERHSLRARCRSLGLLTVADETKDAAGKGETAKGAENKR